MGDSLLAVNAGSSSIKFKPFEIGAQDRLGVELEGQLEGIGTRPHLEARDAAGRTVADDVYEPGAIADVATALDRLEGWTVDRLGGRRPIAIGHRVVHGGPELDAPVRVDAGVLARLEALVPLAPLHRPNNRAPIEAIAERYPDIVQVACLDTAFHRRHPEVADRFAIPEALHREGVRRYGFHGLSYESVAGRLAELDPAPAAGAALAVDHFVYRVVREAGALAAAMGGIDGLVFTAGIGEHSPGIRARVVAGLGRLGAELDEAANRSHATRISTPQSRIAVLVVPTDEALTIARHTLRLVRG